MKRNSRGLWASGLLVVVAMVIAAHRGLGAEALLPPRIDSVVPAEREGLANDPAVIWWDDFDGPVKEYTESEGVVDPTESLGGSGGSMLSLYEKGSRGVGNRKVFFGDSPTGKVVNRGKTYEEIYWRIYVKHQRGWTGGGPAKLSRATSLASPQWAQAMISHLWSSGEALTLDPASGVRADRVVTRKYNDFEMLKWLGNRPASDFAISSTEECGRWVCVEAYVKLNTPGKKDGLNRLWIDGRLEAERTQLDWRGTYTGHGINAVFLETYWNDGSPVSQKRWIDNFVISTKPIGPVTCPRNPTVIRTPWEGPGELLTWEFEIAADPEGAQVVWRSHPLPALERATVDARTGLFTGLLADQSALAPGQDYYIRARQASTTGQTSPWSGWHQPLRTL